ncbi:cytochrome c maturation protein CcmE [Bacillus sp. EB600]|uniref:cytochrome c maturation protein CcmE n=1 Tax=Bacillus sp. EB600 TaxID=2806345 RepID=UPI00210A865E|nr:cytochrome c maturation protein CcmE [Bacillus sp. EB600]MCQ6278058.1 cytochrome c maturation protein CcmE [Bacillus sp. EB600]
MKKNTMVLIGGFIIAGAIVFLLMAATPGSSGVELTMKQLLATQDQHKNDFVTVEGLLIEKSIQWDADKIQLKFDLKDKSGNMLHAEYHGVKPDNFTEGITVILKGSPTGNASFKAEDIQTRCPSKYEGKDVKDMPGYDPKTHKEALNVPTTPKK